MGGVSRWSGDSLRDQVGGDVPERDVPVLRHRPQHVERSFRWAVLHADDDADRLIDHRPGRQRGPTDSSVGVMIVVVSQRRGTTVATANPVSSPATAIDRRRTPHGQRIQVPVQRADRGVVDQRRVDSTRPHPHAPPPSPGTVTAGLASSGSSASATPWPSGLPPGTDRPRGPRTAARPVTGPASADATVVTCPFSAGPSHTSTPLTPSARPVSDRLRQVLEQDVAVNKPDNSVSATSGQPTAGVPPPRTRPSRCPAPISLANAKNGARRTRARNILKPVCPHEHDPETTPAEAEMVRRRSLPGPTSPRDEVRSDRTTDQAAMR